MQTPQQMVEEFHKTFRVPEGPPVPNWHEDTELMKLRMSLIEEEWHELLDAYNDEDFIEVVDALADMVYVIYGFARSIGVDLDEILAEVHRSNMTKLDKDGNPIFRDDGKILKSDLFEEPRIAEVLAKRGYIA